MIKNLTKLALSLTFVVLMMSGVNAQTQYTSNSFGLQIGTTSPFTDVRSHNIRRTWNTGGKGEYKPYIGVHALHMLSHIWGVYADAGYGVLQGVMNNRDLRYPTNNEHYNYQTEDYDLYQRLGFTRQIYAKTQYADASVNLYINISNMGWMTRLANNKNASMRKWGIYGYAGVGMITYAAAKNAPNNAIVNALYSQDQAVIASEESYLHGGAISDKKGLFQTNDLIFPTALGFKYHLTNAIDLSLEATYRFTATDKLDGVANNTLAANPKINNTTLPATAYQNYANDRYAMYLLKISYKLKCCKPGYNNIEWHDPQEAILRNVDAEMAKLKSLLSDSDKDGVSDAFDKEPNTPAGVRVDGAGQALDVDGDGVPDYKDDQPFSPKGATVNPDNGVAVDSDNDGVPDVIDLEPNSKPGALVNFRGITIGQREGTTTPATANASDKPLFIFPSVYFDLNSNEIRPQYYDVLSDAARSLIKYPDVKIDIFGNCDVRGGDQLNNDLGKRRAEAVANYLKKNFNISGDRIKIVETLGKTHPISNQHRPNRRVDILLAQ